MSTMKWPKCQVCGKLVSTEEGVLVIYKNELDAFEEEQQAWEKRNPVSKYGVQTIDTSDPGPMPVGWHWGHAKCLKEGMYEISYDRFDSIGKALSWTLHLMEKNWLDSTNWEQAVRVHHRVPHA